MFLTMFMVTVVTWHWGRVVEDKVTQLCVYLASLATGNGADLLSSDPVEL